MKKVKWNVLFLSKWDLSTWLFSKGGREPGSARKIPSRAELRSSSNSIRAENFELKLFDSWVKAFFFLWLRGGGWGGPLFTDTTTSNPPRSHPTPPPPLKNLDFTPFFNFDWRATGSRAELTRVELFGNQLELGSSRLFSARAHPYFFWISWHLSCSKRKTTNYLLSAGGKEEKTGWLFLFLPPMLFVCLSCFSAFSAWQQTKFFFLWPGEAKSEKSLNR